MHRVVGVGVVLLLSIGILRAQEEEEVKVEEDIERKYVVEEAYIGKIAEPRPQLEYDFEKYLLIGSLLGEGYILDPRLGESLERANSALLKLQSNYLRIPVNTDIIDLTKEELIIPVPPIGGSSTSWELAITDSRGKIFRKIQGMGRPPRQVGWDGLGDNGELFVVGAIYSYEIEATDALGNAQRRILVPPKWNGVLARQGEKWIVSIDTRAFFSGATLTPMGENYLQQVINLIKEKSAKNIEVAAYSQLQVKTVMDYIKGHAPLSLITPRRIGERYVNLEIAFY